MAWLSSLFSWGFESFLWLVQVAWLWGSRIGSLSPLYKRKITMIDRAVSQWSFIGSVTTPLRNTTALVTTRGAGVHSDLQHGQSVLHCLHMWNVQFRYFQSSNAWVYFVYNRWRLVWLHIGCQMHYIFSVQASAQKISRTCWTSFYSIIFQAFWEDLLGFNCLQTIQEQRSWQAFIWV